MALKQEHEALEDATKITAIQPNWPKVGGFSGVQNTTFYRLIQ